MNTAAAIDGGGDATVRVGPAKIIPFPMAARVAFLERMAALIAIARPGKRQAYREHLEKQQYESLRKRGNSCRCHPDRNDSLQPRA